MIRRAPGGVEAITANAWMPGVNQAKQEMWQ